MNEILERWSPRAFDPKAVPDNDVMAVLEAARFAPSCFNEQPWRFIVGSRDSGNEKWVSNHEKVLSLLNETNRRWAEKAPVLLIILGIKAFEKNGKDNFWHLFDSGTAWGFLSLEAQRRGYVTHGMGGFNKQQTGEVFSLSEELQPIAVIALGRHGQTEELPEDLRERELPGSRKPLEVLIL